MGRRGDATLAGFCAGAGEFSELLRLHTGLVHSGIWEVHVRSVTEFGLLGGEVGRGNRYFSANFLLRPAQVTPTPAYTHRQEQSNSNAYGSTYAQIRVWILFVFKFDFNFFLKLFFLKFRQLRFELLCLFDPILLDNLPLHLLDSLIL